MKSLIAAFVTVAALSGCYQVTSAGDVMNAQKICNAHKGVNHIIVEFDGDEFVTCQDETEKLLHNNE